MSTRNVATFFSMCVILVGTKPAYAQTDSDAMSANIRAHTISVGADAHDFGYAFVARRLFALIQNGRDMGLPKADAMIIRTAGQPTGRGAAVDQFLQEFNRALDDPTNSVDELAQVFERGQAAEQRSKELFYRGVIAQLSTEGQVQFESAVTDELQIARFSKTNWRALASEHPEAVREMLIGMAARMQAARADYAE